VEEFRVSAFVLRTYPYGESDLITVMLSRERGKLRAIAKGAKRSKRRFAGGALEPFQQLAMRLGRRENRGLDFLHESQVIGSNAAIAADIEAFAWANYLTEITEAMTVEDDPCPEVFDCYAAVLGDLGKGMPEPPAHHYILRLLDYGGWAPDFSECGICREPIGEYRRPILDQRGSGVICGHHEAERLGIDSSDPEYRPSRRVIDDGLLTYLRQAREQVPADGEQDSRALASALLDRLLDLHLSRVPKSRAFLASLRPPLPRTKQSA
jgi:DNA repair protein RecO (recombination protein O)